MIPHLAHLVRAVRESLDHILGPAVLRTILDRKLTLAFPFALALAFACAWCGRGDEATVEGLLVETLPHLAIVGIDGHSFLFGELFRLVHVTCDEEDLWIVPVSPDLIDLMVIK